jgi:hypothetical protein
MESQEIQRFCQSRSERNSHDRLLLSSYARPLHNPAVAIGAVHPHCPFSGRGVDSPEMRTCPGYEPEAVPVGAERIVGCGESCRHLRGQRRPGRRGGYVSACTHPVLGLPVAPTHGVTAGG